MYTAEWADDNPLCLDLSEFQARFAVRVRRMREVRGLRQEDLEEYGLAWRTIQKLEYGHTDVKISTLLKLCQAFNVTLLELLSMDEAGAA